MKKKCLKKKVIEKVYASLRFYLKWLQLFRISKGFRKYHGKGHLKLSFKWHSFTKVHLGGRGVLSYMSYMGMCRCEGYGFQAA